VQLIATLQSKPSVPLGAAQHYRRSSGASTSSGGKPTLAELAQNHSQDNNTSNSIPPQGANRTATHKPDGDSSSNRDKKNAMNKAGGSWFGGLFNKFRNKNEMILPDDKNPTIVWDPDKQRWINTEASEEEQARQNLPPPKDSELIASPSGGGGPPSQMGTPAKSGAPPPSTPASNRFSLQKTRGARGQYVDVFASNAGKPAASAPSNLFNVLPKSASMPANIFVPPVSDQNAGEGHTPTPETQQSQQQPEPHAQESENQQQDYSYQNVTPIQQGHGVENQQHPQESGAWEHQQQQPPTQQFYNPAQMGAPPSYGQTGYQGQSENSQVGETAKQKQQDDTDVANVGQGDIMPPPQPQMPVMFNPAQFNQGSSAPQPSGPGRGPRYGQRRAYPK